MGQTATMVMLIHQTNYFRARSSLLKLMAFGLMWELVVAVSYCRAVGVLEINGMLKGRFVTSWVWPCAEFIP